MIAIIEKAPPAKAHTAEPIGKTTIFVDARAMIRLDHRRDIDLENALHDLARGNRARVVLVATPEYLEWAYHTLEEAGVWPQLFPVQSTAEVKARPSDLLITNHPQNMPLAGIRTDAFRFVKNIAGLLKIAQPPQEEPRPDLRVLTLRRLQELQYQRAA